MQNKGSETGRENRISCFTFLRLLGAWAIGYFVYRAAFADNLFGNARSFLVLTLVVSLISAGFVNINTAIGIDAFAKKNSKKSSDRANRIIGRDKGSDTGTDNSLEQLEEPPTTTGEKQQRTEPIVPPPLPVETPTNSKFVIINFDDSHESEYTYAKPILDKYGFKATFFEVCNWIESGHHDKDISTTWEQIAALQQDGMDIEAHTMTHPNLNDLSSQADLDYEIGQSKQCLENHGINPTIFAYPNGEGSDNIKVVKTVAKYYNLARTDSKSALTFLHCDGGSDIGNNEQQQQQQQTDCRTSFSDGTLSPANRYSINSWAHKHIERGCSANDSSSGSGDDCSDVRYEYDNSQMFEKFVTAVNSQDDYNKDGIVRAIPIIIYHTIVTYPDLSDSNRPIDTTLNLFDAEMKYLYDNGFKVITMADLGYDENTKSLYIKGT
jgi:peptidoglycan/xylan/chitin deacetylase (PgdA/CDA1 family)